METAVSPVGAVMDSDFAARELNLQLQVALLKKVRDQIKLEGELAQKLIQSASGASHEPVHLLDTYA